MPKIESGDVKSFLFYFEDPVKYDRLFAFGWSTPMTIKALETHGLDKVRSVDLKRQERKTDKGTLVKLTPKASLPLGFAYITFVEEGNMRQLLEGYVFDVVPTGYTVEREKIRILYSEFYKNLLNPRMDIETVLNFVTPGEREGARKILEENANRLRELSLKSVDEVALRIMMCPEQPDLGALIVEVEYDDERRGWVEVDTLKCPAHKIGEMWYLFEFHKEPFYHF